MLKLPILGTDMLTVHLLGWCLLVCALTSSASAENNDPDLLVVREFRWGFDSTVQTQSFVPLSVHVQNAAAIPWTGTLTLSRGTLSAGSNGRPAKNLGIASIQEITLQANEDRWVQFVPFIIDDLDSWMLRWGPQANHVMQLTNLTKGPRPTVLITDPDAVTATGGPLRNLPEPLFPTALAATEALRGVIFEKAPFWQGARARTFNEWLNSGGRVYILHNENGVYPHFNKPLEFLNTNQTSFSVGRGIVKKVPLQAGEISIEDARKQLFNDDNSQSRPPKSPWGQQNYQFTTTWNRYGELFRELRPVTVFQRRWSIIYLSVLAYLGMLIYCYRIGRRNDQVRWFYSAFLVSVAIFSLIFIALGQLGASVQNRTRMTSLVQHVHDHAYEVTDWGTAANVNKGTFTLQFDGTGHCLTTCTDTEHVKGAIQFGSTSSMQLIMPPATMRTFMQKRRITREQTIPAVTQFKIEANLLETMSVSIRDCFDEDILQAYAVHRGIIYPLEQEGETLKLTRQKNIGRPLQADLYKELSRVDLWGWQMSRQPGLFRIHRQDDQQHSHQEHYEAMLKSLVGNSYGLIQSIDPRKLRLSPNLIRLFVYTKSPALLKCQTTDFPDQDGTALFVFDLPTTTTQSIPSESL